MKNTAVITVLVAIIISAAVLLELSRQSMQETQDLGRCLVEQVVEHRLDVREAHEALAHQHNDFRERNTSLPPPPGGLPQARPEIQAELLEACEEYLNQSRFSR